VCVAIDPSGRGVECLWHVSTALCALAACRSLSVSTHGRARMTGLPMQELDLDADHPVVVLAALVHAVVEDRAVILALARQALCA
jgi:hypothetical protein